MLKTFIFLVMTFSAGKIWAVPNAVVHQAYVHDSRHMIVEIAEQKGKDLLFWSDDRSELAGFYWGKPEDKILYKLNVSLDDIGVTGGIAIYKMTLFAPTVNQPSREAKITIAVPVTDSGATSNVDNSGELTITCDETSICLPANHIYKNVLQEAINRPDFELAQSPTTRWITRAFQSLEHKDIYYIVEASRFFHLSESIEVLRIDAGKREIKFLDVEKFSVRPEGSGKMIIFSNGERLYMPAPEESDIPFFSETNSKETMLLEISTHVIKRPEFLKYLGLTPNRYQHLTVRTPCDILFER